MACIRGHSSGQGSLFPISLDELLPEDHLVRVIAAYVACLERQALPRVLSDCGAQWASPASTGLLPYSDRTSGPMVSSCTRIETSTTI